MDMAVILFNGSVQKSPCETSAKAQDLILNRSLYVILKNYDFIHVYSPGAWADNSRGFNFDCN